MAFAPSAEGDVLDLDEIADVDVRTEPGTGTKAGKRSDAGSLADRRSLDVAKSQDLRALFHRHSGAEDDIGLDRHVGSDLEYRNATRHSPERSS